VHNVAAYAATGARTYTGSGKSISKPVAYAGAKEASCRQNTSSPKYLYHYTDSSSAGKIERSGRIHASSGPGDCALGEGTYFTAKPPRTSSDQLLSNNYDGASSSYDMSRVESYVRVDADRLPHRSGREDLGRDVFVVPGSVKLSSAGGVVGHRY
jgi:hypothetical protein